MAEGGEKKAAPRRKAPVKKGAVAPRRKAPVRKAPAAGKKPASKKPASKKPATKKPATKKPAKKGPTKYKVASEAVRKVPVLGPDGKATGKVDLPTIFNSSIRTDLIRRAVKSARANRQRAYGPAPMAGMRHAVSQWGKGRGSARVQRLTQGNAAAESPNNVGGRRAHPPRPDQDRSEHLNRKEARKARSAALAAVADAETVRGRGHLISEDLQLPLVVSDAWEDLDRTKSVNDALAALDLSAEIERSANSRNIRAGRGTMRNRRYKHRLSLLMVVSGAEKARGFRNLLGVEVVEPRMLNPELLAPGGDPGRLVIFTKPALEEMRSWSNV